MTIGSVEKFLRKMYLLLFTIITSTLLCCEAQVQQSNLRINTDLTAVNSNDKPKRNDDAPIPTILEPIKNISQQQQQLLEKNICTRNENYTEIIKIPVMEPVRLRTSDWCMDFPPRCTSYKTTMRERIEEKNVTKTRTISFCCSGYERNLSKNETVCKPVCYGGCGRGSCDKPNVCICEPGYTGKHCTQRCDHDRWGPECKNECQCQNGAVCDNKSGICHCTTGWEGTLCENPCPEGTYGVMCRKNCTCKHSDNHCHPQTGACADGLGVIPDLTGTHHMIETLNSTIANITNNLDLIAKNIGQITPSSTESFNELTPKPIPEVILIKQEETQHTPKIIVHQTGTDLLENLHTATAAKTPDVIHVITNWPTNATPTQETKLNLAGFGGIDMTQKSNVELSEHAKTAAEHDNNLLTTLLIILLIIMIGIAVSFLYVYRRYHWQKEHVEAAIAARTNGSLATSNGLPLTTGMTPGGEVALIESTLNKSFLKPLPDLPGLKQAICNKIDGPELYDAPSNNSSIKTPPYAYARKESLYSVVTPKSRKGSMDSHLYDEIHYPGHHHRLSGGQLQHNQHHHHHHLQQQQQQQMHQDSLHSYSPPPPHLRYEHATTAAAYLPPASVYQNPPVPAHHVSHFVIPPQNSKFLQVPATTLTKHKVAHI